MPNSGKAQIGVDVAATSTTLSFALGTEAEVNGNVYRFVKAGSAIAAGDFLKLDTANADEPNAMIPTAAVNEVVAGCAPVAIASGSYGWIVVRGKVAAAKLAASTAAGAVLGTSATAGTLSTITITATYVQGESQRLAAAAAGCPVQAVDAEASGTGEVYLH